MMCLHSLVGLLFSRAVVAVVAHKLLVAQVVQVWVVLALLVLVIVQPLIPLLVVVVYEIRIPLVMAVQVFSM
jgi:hypothetical protein